MRNKYVKKMKVFKAIKATVISIKSCWRTLLLFVIMDIATDFALQTLFIRTEIFTFYGATILLNIPKVLYVMVIIKTVSNAMKGESVHPIHIMKKTLSKSGQLLFQGIICTGVLLLPAIIIFVLMMAITETQLIPTYIFYILLGLACVKIIFSSHGVLVSGSDAMEGIIESLSLTKGNYFRLLLTLISLWLLNYGIQYVVFHTISGPLNLYFVYSLAKDIIIVFQVALITSLYHQVAYFDVAKRADAYEMP